MVGGLSLKIHSKTVENKAVKNFEKKLSNNNEKNEPIPKIGEEMGIIEIPSINLKTVIVNGTDKKYLKYYVCHFETSAMPGENGNFSLAGHSSYVYNQVFDNLHKVVLNDEIKIKTINNEYIYKITEISETNPSNISVLEQNMDNKEITLVTCVDEGKNRLIVKGEIIKS